MAYQGKGEEEIVKKGMARGKGGGARRRGKGKEETGRGNGKRG
jgi:hypothetical protein